uniref:Uncharacterized protein n=1 Tax=Arundo donax TaxID=35708 RepID=A0A0A8Z094_ARUDO
MHTKINPQKILDDEGGKTYNQLHLFIVVKICFTCDKKSFFVSPTYGWHQNIKH